MPFRLAAETRELSLFVSLETLHALGGEAVRWLHPWPVSEPPDWKRWVNEPQTEAELAAVRCSVVRGRPYDASPFQVFLVKEAAQKTR